MIITSSEGELSLAVEKWEEYRMSLSRGSLNDRSRLLAATRPSQSLANKAAELEDIAYQRASVACEAEVHKVRGASKSWKPFTRRPDGLSRSGSISAEALSSVLVSILKSVFKGYPGVIPASVSSLNTTLFQVTVTGPYNLAVIRYLNKLSSDLLTVEVLPGASQYPINSVDGGSFVSSKRSARYIFSQAIPSTRASLVRFIRDLPGLVRGIRQVAVTLSRVAYDPSGLWGEGSRYNFRADSLSATAFGHVVSIRRAGTYQQLLGRSRSLNAEYNALSETDRCIFVSYQQSGSGSSAGHSWKRMP